MRVFPSDAPPPESRSHAQSPTHVPKRQLFMSNKDTFTPFHQWCVHEHPGTTSSFGRDVSLAFS